MAISQRERVVFEAHYVDLYIAYSRLPLWSSIECNAIPYNRIRSTVGCISQLLTGLFCLVDLAAALVYIRESISEDDETEGRKTRTRQNDTLKHRDRHTWTAE